MLDAFSEAVVLVLQKQLAFWSVARVWLISYKPAFGITSAKAVQVCVHTDVICAVVQHKDTFWAEPKNNNPLEKSTGMRESFTSESSDQKAESAVRSYYLVLLMQRLHHTGCLRWFAFIASVLKAFT